MAQLSESQLATIRDHPIGDALDSCRDALGPAFPRADPRGAIGRFEQLVGDPTGENVVFKLIGTLLAHPAALHLPSHDEKRPLLSDLGQLASRLSTDRTNAKHAARLVRDVVAGENDPTIWAAVYDLIRQTQPALPPAVPLPTTSSRTGPATSPLSIATITPSLQQTPTVFHSGSNVDTSKIRDNIDPLLKIEVERSLIIDHPQVFDVFWGRVTQLPEIATAVWDKCKSADEPIYSEGARWVDWPPSCNEDEVLRFLRRHVDQFLAFAGNGGFRPSERRRCVTTPNQPLPGSIGKRKLDIGIARGNPSEPDDNSAPCHWSHVLIPGELKSNPSKDN